MSRTPFDFGFDHISLKKGGLRDFLTQHNIAWISTELVHGLLVKSERHTAEDREHRGLNDKAYLDDAFNPAINPTINGVRYRKAHFRQILSQYGVPYYSEKVTLGTLVEMFLRHRDFFKECNRQAGPALQRPVCHFVLPPPYLPRARRDSHQPDVVDLAMSLAVEMGAERREHEDVMVARLAEPWNDEQSIIEQFREEPAEMAGEAGGKQVCEEPAEVLGQPVDVPSELADAEFLGGEAKASSAAGLEREAAEETEGGGNSDLGDELEGEDMGDELKGENVGDGLEDEGELEGGSARDAAIVFFLVIILMAMY